MSLVAKNRSIDCLEIFTRYVKYFGLVPDVLLFFQKKFLLTIFVKNNLHKIDFFSFYADAKTKNLFSRNQKQGRVNAITKLICYYLFVVGSLPESVSGTPFTFALSADSNSRTYIFFATVKSSAMLCVALQRNVI